MDITMFNSLNPAVLKILNVSTVRALMGVNLADLKLFENSSVVQSWVAQQNQSDLNTLNLGIINHNPCYGVESHTLDSEFASGNISAVLCNFSIPDYACSSVAVLSSNDLVTLLTCKLPSSLSVSKDAWKLFFQNFSGPLDDALESFSNVTDSSIQTDPNILDAIGEVIIDKFTAAELVNATFITVWFQIRLRPFLSSVSKDFLSSLGSQTFSCETYQIVVQALSSQESLMKEEQKQMVFTWFIFPFLLRNDLPDPRCLSNTSGSNDWLEKNLGSFSDYASLEVLKLLNANFSSVEVLDLLSSEQKAQFILHSGVLANDSVFREVFSSVITSLDLNQLGSFFEAFSQTAIQMNMTSIPSAISDTILNMTLLDLVPHFQTFSPEDFALWFQTYLSLFLPGISPNTLSIIPMNISCDSYREIVKGLDNVYSDLSATQSNTVFNYTQDYVKYQSSQGLSCYGTGSFYVFLKQLFLNFGFPDLKDFLSLIPGDRLAELLGSISPEELSEFLNRPDTVINASDLCTLLNNYNRTNQYLEMETVLSSALASYTLECVLSRALTASSQAEVEQWFDVTLLHYLPYLNSHLISSAQLSGASCLSYRKLVSILGDNYNFSATDFTPADVYSSITVYLNSSDGSPRCYNSSDPLLNSTAWFADNIGFFITFITLTDLQSFLSGNMSSVFLENSENLQLFNNSGISTSVLEYYTNELYIQNPDFSPLGLPAELLCRSPASVFERLGDEDITSILNRINDFCTEINPEVTAVLVAKFPNVSASIIQSLGSQCVGLTVGQISSAPSDVINSSLSILSSINGWDQGQVNSIIQSIISAGFTISSASSLESLGTLIGGVLSANISIIPSSQLVSLSQNPTFINNIISAPVILQNTFVQKVISVDHSKVLENVPDALVMYIPLVLLTSLSSVDVSLINNKSWSHEQAMMLFGAVASASDDPEDLSTSILQGFSCSSVQTLPQQKAKDLVKACRPREGRDKVHLKEAQLTCMYNYMKDDPSVNFTDIPSEMLLYYSYEKIQKVNCQAYFSALGRADFSVLSLGLDKKDILFNHAKNCLGISGASLTSHQVEVLGNMACTLDSSYIQNSDPLILEKLKNCEDLSDSQITAVQLLLLSGNTAYGNPSMWNEETVEQLSNLAVYFKSDICNKLSFNVKRKFLSVLREQKIPLKKLRTFFTECNSESTTVSNITAVTISDPSFPFGFNSTQFDLYLDITVLQDNLAAITEKVVDTSLQTVILNKLNQIYPSGLNDGVLQLLGSTSRVATTDDISKWNITIIDTLSSLMDSNAGHWEKEKSKAVIMRYLSMGNHSLGSAEINVVGSNICTLDISVLENITAESLTSVLSPDLSSCSIEQKSALYIIANSSFSNQRSSSTTFYQLIRPYLGGAPVNDIQALSTQNISMDITMFNSLNPAVLKILNVSTVRALMGVNLADLKLFENSSVVQSWVAQQNQSDLNTLNLGIINHNPCYGVESHTLDSEFASGNISAVLCNFSIPDYACSSVAVLSSNDLVTLLTCKLPSSLSVSKDAWKLFFQNFSGPLDDALESFSNVTDSSIQTDPNILDAIGEVIIDKFTAAELVNATFITVWFQIRLRPFLSSVSKDFLSSLGSQTFSCETYQIVVQALSSQESLMKEEQKQMVFTWFIFPFLLRNDLPDPRCLSNTSGSNDWLEKNLGSFSDYASLEVLKLLNANFSSVEVLDLLSSEQKAQFILHSGVLANDSVFREVFSSVITSLDLNQLGSFFEAFSQTAIQMNMTSIPSAISDTILNMTLLDLVPHFQTFSPEDFALWFQTYLSLFLPGISPNTLSIIPMNISCDSYREIVKGLDNVYSDLSATQSNTVFNYTQDYVKYQSSQGLSCYGTGSFYVFLKQLFLNFGFPDLKDFLSLIPGDRLAELLGSISPEELSEFLNRPDTVINASDLCTLLNNYNRTNQYLEMETVLSSALASYTLECVLSRALTASSQAEVEQWFDVTLLHYLPYLNSHLISSAQLSGASCLSYRKLVSILGDNYNFSATDFTPADVYSSITVYLNSSDGSPRCYNSSDPLLNSTAWFADNIGFFITFITLTDLQSFLSGNMSSVFLENSENLQLFNNSGISTSVLEYYTNELYIQNPDFSPLGLPAELLCRSPASVFERLGDEDITSILNRINDFCTEINPEVTAVLVAKFPNVSASIIQSLGSQCVGLTVGQISSAPSDVINSSLSILSSINGWDQGQVNSIIQSIISAGFTISSASSLESLGTLIGGVLSANISIIPSSQLVSLSQNPTFINNIISAPVILQNTFVQKVISVDHSKVLENVPDALVMYIPLVLLTSLSSVDVSLINNKSWSHEQAMMLFGAVASASDDPEDLSTSILQGFSCSSVQTLPQQKAKDLVKACRPREGRDKVHLKEAQLTCMYNYMKDDPSVNFTDIPSEMLLYYSYEKIQKVNCQAYFSALGRADFSVLSLGLDKKDILFNHAKNCLGISGASLTSHQVEVLGNMACTLDSSYIQNSDPLILEKLKNCEDLSDSQITAVQLLLLSGNTAYGNPSMWNEETVEQLSNLAVYFKSDICNKLSFNVKRKFLSVLREQKIPLKKLRTFFTECNSESTTVSNITAVTISDPSFPFGFNSTQFDLYLDITVLQDNLAAITEKVVDTSLQTVILNKLNQIYPSGLNDGVLQLLGSTSRVATTDDISKWNITIIDTLSSLMDSNAGHWGKEKSKAVIMRYLSMGNHSLGSAEINVVGSNICTLDISVLENITAESLTSVLSPDLSSCSIEQKSALYIIANSSFSNQRSSSTTFYQLIRPYLGGAPVEDIQALSIQNISMDITIFTTLNPTVLMVLNVSTVKDLMGLNVADLKLFENSSIVQFWVSQQNQSDLDILNLGITNTDSNNYTTIISTTTPSTTTATDTAISTVSTPVTSAILNISASPTTSFKVTTSFGTTVNMTATTNAILNTTTSPTTSIKINPSFGTTVNMTATNPTTNAFLNTTTSPTTSIKITPSLETTVNMTATNPTTNAFLNTTTSPTTSIKITPSLETTVNMTATNPTTKAFLNTTTSPTTSIKITPSLETTVNMTATNPTTKAFLNTTTSPTTSIKITPSFGTTVNMTATNPTTKAFLNTTTSPTTSIKITPSLETTVNMTATNPTTKALLNTTTSPTTSIKITPSLETTVNMTATNPTTKAFLNTTTSPTTSIKITPSLETTVNMTATNPTTNAILSTTTSPTTSIKINPSFGTTVNMTATNPTTKAFLNTTTSPTTSIKITPSLETTVNMTATNPTTKAFLNTTTSPTTSIKITPSFGTTVSMTATNPTTKAFLNTTTSPTTSIKINPSFGTTVNMTATNPTTKAFLNTTTSPTTSIKITPSFENNTSVPVNPCQGVDSQAIETTLLYGNASAVLCNFSITDYACSSVAGLSTEDLAKLLTCETTGSIKYTKDIWKLFFNKFAAHLDEALDKVYSMTLISAVADPNLLDAIGEVIISKFTAAQLVNAIFITEWFQIRLRPFLSSVSKDFLSSLSSKTFSCETYQIVVQALSSQESLMKEEQKQMVFTWFIFPFLLRNDLPDPRCLSNTSGSNDWLEKNLGSFSDYASLEVLKLLNANFSSVEVLGLLSSEQKAQFILHSGVLANDSVFREVFSSVITSLDLNQLGSFLEAFNETAIQMNMTSIPSAISDTILNMTLLDLVPHFQTFSPEDFALWFQTYLSLFLHGISPNTLSIIPMNISCDSYREIVKGFNDVYSDLSTIQSIMVFNYTQDYLKYQSSQGLSCYGTGSFYVFLKQLFLNFGFPDLKDFLSLIPGDRLAELLGSISLEELSEFLNRPDTVINASDLCTLLNNYNRTNQYLEMETVLSSALASYTLECVLSRALTASSQAEVEQWFDVTLLHYLPYLNSHLISSAQLSGASCLSYRKLVSILGDSYNFSATDFTPADVYSSIKVYLNSSDGSPRCYNSSDPLLNSTAWFADNIGFFITFITLTDLQSFLSDSKIGVFLENSENLQLFSNSKISASVTEYYTTQLYIQNPNFNPLRLPGGLLCEAPSSAFVPLGDADSQTILLNINKSCNEINREVTVTLVEKFPTLSASTIQLLGSQSVGLTAGQISSAPPNVIYSALSILSNINSWDQGQASALIQSIISAGFKINSTSSLLSLGTLIEGVPSAAISSIPSSQLLTLSHNPSFINNILSAPVILQETFAQQVISADQTKVIENVPDSLVMYIPVALLSSLSSIDVSLINNKSWSHEQAMMLFDSVTSASDNPENLSASVLQGFSCSSVQTLPQQKIKDLVKACRPRAGRDKVLLKEAQLTCMYKIMKEDTVNYADVPSDMLLYYSYDKVKHKDCRSYFTALGGADFSVPSSILNIAATQFDNARDCLGISGASLTRDQVEVLGNMACTLDSSYIQNSDPLILEKLKNCEDLSDSQISAIQSLLLSGKTVYGNPLKWNAETLGKLSILPLYFKSDFWGQFSYDLKKTFIKLFMPFLRNKNIPIQKLKNFFVECNSKLSKINRVAVCTTGQITAVTIADASFPLGYDATQFDLCLNNTILQDNLAAITEKVVDSSFQTVILNKLNQIYPSGINDGVLQLLGSTSRMATIDDISKWKITIIDTLSSLMNPKFGNWAPEMSNAVISRYLSVADHTLGTAEINAVGSSICSLDVSVLENITAESLKKANTLDLSSCSIQQKSALYIIGESSFSGQNSTARIYYQLIRPYLGGAPVQDIQALSIKNVNMDVTTFMNLNPAVIMSLNVSTVEGLLGVNLADLKLFENSSVVQSWVARQSQSDLNTLNIGLIGGKIPSVTSQPNITTVTTSQINQTTSANSTAQASGAPMFHAGAWFLPLCVGLLTIAHTIYTT
ncbi:uncharacterized protein LOC131347029 [Hemibagrus wyckioides]|uniref:uncharacterized protein LOC131347029 n=1 Tax=Hemibagrus wyckioides TaxID=337641 RepID=UPI00266D8278|nr:uncharacterized protein LOC131347029 [Hemibagrus wyckioides]